MSKENYFVSFYSRHNISPVRQDISNLKNHYLRREKLYRSLGLPPSFFKNKTILEVGPGGGYNSLVFAYWGAEIHFVEPNPTAVNEIPNLMSKHSVNRNQWKIVSQDKIEDFNLDHTYDLVVAEGFLSGLTNQNEVVTKLSKLVNPGGVLVMTCLDEISTIFEIVKRGIAFKLIQNVDAFEEKVKILTSAFKTHLDSLKYASRLPEDWVIDSFLNPAWHGHFFTLEDAFQFAKKDFYVLGTSPQFITDWSWYKNTDVEQTDLFLNLFFRTRHMLISTELDLTLRTPENNAALYKEATYLRQAIIKLETHNTQENWSKFISHIEKIISLCIDINENVAKSLQEGIDLLRTNDLTTTAVSCAPHLAPAFGRGQQYISLCKKDSNIV